MQIDTGLAVVIAAVLIFYLRLIIIQRERARRVKAAASAPVKKGKGKDRQPAVVSSFGILSAKPVDRMIGAAGALALVIGMLLYAGVFRLPAVSPYWWIPAAAGIVLFSWAFKL